MTVQVTVSRQVDGTASTVETHERGKAVMVREGHLAVLTDTGQFADTLAMYAPGTWAAATVDG